MCTMLINMFRSLRMLLTKSLIGEFWTSLLHLNLATMQPRV
uniref:NAC038 n=1 Tax=Arundo donax TaxID=35708 RepID=A0A0A9GWT9_ARUDO